jgi:hypothetical protein
MAEKTILGTITGEFFQPVRLHYRVLDSKGLLRAFEKLRCVEQDPPRHRWVWKYADEAKSLKFKQSYAQIPKELHPIVLGSFFHRTEDQLLLERLRQIIAMEHFSGNAAYTLADAVGSITKSK